MFAVAIAYMIVLPYFRKTAAPESAVIEGTWTAELPSPVVSFALGPDGLSAIVVDGEQRAWIAEPERDPEIVRTRVDHAEFVPSLGFVVGDSERMIVAEGDWTAEGWWAQALADGRVATAAGTSLQVRTPQEVERTLDLPESDGKLIAASRDGQAAVYSIANGGLRLARTEAEPIDLDTEAAVHAIDFSTDGRSFVVGDEAGFRLLRARTGEQVHPVRPRHRQLIGRTPTHVTTHGAPVTSVAFDPQGRMLLTVGGGKLMFWRVDTLWNLDKAPPERVQHLNNAEAVQAQYSPEGGAIGVLDSDGKLHIVANPYAATLRGQVSGARRGDTLGVRVLRIEDDSPAVAPFEVIVGDERVFEKAIDIPKGTYHVEFIGPAGMRARLERVRFEDSGPATLDVHLK